MAPHYLDQIPLDFSNPAVKELRNILSANYYRSAQVIALVQDAGVQPAWINWDQPMVFVWDDVLGTLQKQAKLRIFLQNLIAGPDAALAGRLRELTADRPVTAAPGPAGRDISMPGSRPGDYEKIIASESTLLDVSFLERGAELAPAVVRLLVTLDGEQFFGTAFRIGDDLLLTNHHVLFARSGQPATAVDAWFGYERAFGGLTKAHISIPGRVDTIAGEPVHDWAVVRLAGNAPEGVPVISLAGAAPIRVDDRVYIIQHPNGGVKKIGMIHNVVRYVDDDVIRYWTDTEGGSSGAPVFNEQWQVVALHHRWVMDNTGTATEIRNQGRRIERVVAGLAAAGIG
jgi:V8-like Glu-specific endopeptidase